MKTIIISVLYSALFLMTCGKNGVNNDEDDGNGTLYLGFEGVVKTYTAAGLTDSSALTDDEKDYLRDSVDFFLDTLVLTADSFSLVMNDDDRLGYLYGWYETIPESVILHFERMVHDTQTVLIDSSGNVFYQTMGFAGDRERMRFSINRVTKVVYSGPTIFRSSFTRPGVYDFSQVDSIISGFGADDSLIIWDYEMVFE